MGFSRQEYWSGLRCPPPGDLSDSAIEPASLASPALAGGFFTLHHLGSPYRCLSCEFPFPPALKKALFCPGWRERKHGGAGTRCQPAVFFNFPLSGRGAAVSVQAVPRLQGKDAREPRAAEARVGMNYIKRPVAAPHPHF